MKHNPGRLQQLTVAGALAALSVAACGTVSPSTQHSGRAPIIVGATEPLTGQFSADGIASLHGLELWASDVNQFGGLLGRPVRLKILDDNSNPDTVTSDYTKLITQDHVNFTIAPFSSLLTVEAAQVTRKYRYALMDASGGAPSIYALDDPWVFGITTPVVDQMVPFATWILSPATQPAAHHRGLPDGQRPVRRPTGGEHRADAVNTGRHQDGLLQRAPPGHGQRDRFQHSPGRGRGRGPQPAARGARHRSTCRSLLAVRARVPGAQASPRRS